MNETTGGRRRWYMARPRRAGVLAVTAGLVLLTAACGGSTSSSGSPSSSGTGGASSAFVSHELAFAGCVRAHGVPNFPDPDANGQEPASTKQLLDSNPAALRACNYLIRPAPSAVAAQNQAYQREDVRFAECMRAHGVPNFPDPTTESDGAPIFYLSPAITQLPQVLATAHRCQSLLHLAQLPNYAGVG